MLNFKNVKYIETDKTIVALLDVSLKIRAPINSWQRDHVKKELKNKLWEITYGEFVIPIKQIYRIAQLIRHSSLGQEEIDRNLKMLQNAVVKLEDLLQTKGIVNPLDKKGLAEISTEPHPTKIYSMVKDKNNGK